MKRIQDIEHTTRQDHPTQGPGRRRWLAAVAGLALTAPLGTAWANDSADARSLVESAKGTLADVLSHKEFAALRAGIKQAKGVLIFPKVLKAGFLLGGSGGNGVLLVRGANNEWHGPAFYTMGSVSFGVQFGGQQSAVIVLVNSQKAVDGLMANSLKLGTDASAAAGPIGEGQSIIPQADFVSFAKAKGAFVGFSIEGSVLDVRGALNRAYYGREASPIEIVVKHEVSNKQADPLRKALAKASM